MELPIQMTDAKTMYNYSCENGFGKGMGNGGLRDFTLIQRRLESGEAAFLTFIGLHRFRSMSSHQRNFAYAITNRRIIMAHVRSFGRIRFESVALNNIANLSFNSDSTISVMKITTPEETIQVGMSHDTANALSQKLTQLLPLIQSLARGLEDTQSENQT